jgi:SWI/SNF-related matrix-associated actin-dependent regulator 1 of chromatin subfamily A
VFIISYNIATKLAGIIQRRGFEMMIVDEAHSLKSRDSLRAKNLVPVLMRSKRVLLLSGTPILSRPAECYNLLRILRPDVFYSFNTFGKRYCNPKEEHYGIDWSGSKNQRELHLLIER